jgi:Zn-dependent alcohol dehydrogenase
MWAKASPTSASATHVVSSFVSMCGKCRYCQTGRPQLCDQAAKAAYTLPDGTVRTKDRQGKPLNIFSGCGVMAEVRHASRRQHGQDRQGRSRSTAPRWSSCGVMTGVGAVVNTARVAPGSVTVVFGCGGVGLNAIQGCVIAGAAMIVAVDMSDAKLEMARQFGATHVLNAKTEENVVKAIRKMTGGGADYRLRVRRLRRDRRPGLRLPAQGRHGGGGRRRRARRTPRRCARPA